VDVLIDVPEKEEFTLFDIAEIQERISQAVHRSADVVMLSALRPQVRKRIQKDLRLICEA
jgi:predicted nucleotidyltransferase